MIGFGSNILSENPLDYELAEMVSQNKSDNTWNASNGKTYKYIIPYRFFNPDDMGETNRFMFKLVDGKPKLCL